MMTTYAKLHAAAEEVSIDQLEQLLEADNMPDIFPGRGKPRRLALSATVRILDELHGKASVIYSYSKPSGYLGCDMVHIGFHNMTPVFRFSDGQVVRVVAR